MMLSRRRFVQGAGAVGLGLLAGCARLPGQAEAPQSAKTYRIGYLGPAQSGEEVRAELRQLGYIEDGNLVYVARTDPSGPAYAAYAAELVQAPVDVIVTAGFSSTRAARAATADLPIVQARGGVDLVQAGLAASYAHPAGNVTGVTLNEALLVGKRLELLRDATAGFTRVGVLWNASNAAKAAEVREARKLTDRSGTELLSLEIRTPGDLDGEFKKAIAAGTEALLALQEDLTNDIRETIVELASRARLPAMYSDVEYVRVGGLMAYAARRDEALRHGVGYVHKILTGAKAGDLPIEQPMTFDFIINLQTAQTLSLTIPPHVLLQATEVIQ
jgi:putative ABC transport system substrate-binding protein